MIVSRLGAVYALSLLPALLFAAGAPKAESSSTIVIDLMSAPQPSIQTLLAVQTCAGLFNRAGANATLPSVYVLLHDKDAQWLTVLQPSLPSPPPLTPATAFLAQCLASPVVTGRIRYSLASQQAVLPLLLTAAGVLNAIPLEDETLEKLLGLHHAASLQPLGALPVAFDALAAWGGLTPADATADAFSRWGNATSSLAWMNPGYVYNSTTDPLAPPLAGVPDLSLADFVVSARLFNLYLPLGCVPLTHDHDVLDTIAAAAPWPRPVTVWGYDDTLPLFGGDVFEAETTCTSLRDMGQAATSGVSNLAFTARAAPVTTPLGQPPLPQLAYNTSRTYVAFIVGDGDNIAYIKETRFDWFQQRLASCAGSRSALAEGGSSPNCSYPLSWTISPHLLQAAPDVLRWYYAGTAATGRDYFLLPPSGHLYAYPGLMPSDTQAAFVAATEEDARLLNCSGAVEWEVAGTWAGAAASYMPRYAARGIVQALFAVNVPYLLPLVELFPLGDDGPAVLDVARNTSGSGVFLFRPQEWRGTTGGGLGPFMLSPAQFAARLSALPRGTVTHIYLTSDGGAQWSDFTALAAALEEHVEVVPAGSLPALAGAALASAAGS